MSSWFDTERGMEWEEWAMRHVDRSLRYDGTDEAFPLKGNQEDSGHCRVLYGNAEDYMMRRAPARVYAGGYSIDETRAIVRRKNAALVRKHGVGSVRDLDGMGIDTYWADRNGTWCEWIGWQHKRYERAKAKEAKAKEAKVQTGGK